MEKKKGTKRTVLITGKAELKVTATQLRDKSVDKKKVRGPKQIGQYKNSIVVRFGHITSNELFKRVSAAQLILQKGKIPAAVKEPSVKAKAATDAGRKKAEKELAELKAKYEVLEKALADKTKALKEFQSKYEETEKTLAEKVEELKKSVEAPKK